MGKRRFSIGLLGRKQLVVAVVFVLSVTACLSRTLPAQVNEADKERIIRQVAEYWIQVGERQYERGLYTHAEKSLRNALEYEQYLTADQIKKLGELSQKTSERAGQRAQILQHIREANALIQQNHLIEARSHLDSIRDNQFLTGEERSQVMAGLAKIDETLNEQKRRITELYNRGMEFYRSLAEARTQLRALADNEFLTDIEREEIAASLSTVEFRITQEQGRVNQLYNLSMRHFQAGQFQQAEQCAAQMRMILTGSSGLPAEAAPDQVGAEQTPAIIEQELFGVMGEAIEPAVPKEEPAVVDTPELFIINVVDEPNRPALIEMAEPVPPPPAPEQVPQKAEILRTYTAAVVSDTVQKVQNYVMRGEFEEARKAVATAERTVSENQIYLGEELFVQYRSQLRQLRRRIAEREDAGRQQ